MMDTLCEPGSLRRLLAPRSVAVVGVSADPAGFGARTLLNLRDFEGPAWAVNPKNAGGTLHGRACFAALADLPAPPDCVVIALPRPLVAGAVEAAAAAGAGGVVLYASGYGETGIAGRDAEESALGAQARRLGLPVLGPNCLGFVDHARRAGCTFMPDYPRMTAPAGGVAIASQSGALGYALMQAAERGVPLRHMATAGNSVGLDVCDLAAFQLTLPECRAVAVVIEGLRAGRRLLALGAAARAAGKPVVALKLGRGEAGAAAAVSHTGSLAGSAAAWSAAFRAAGIAEVEDWDALLETAAFLGKAPPPRGRGIGVMTPSGGAGIMAADHAEAAGLDLPQPGPEAAAVLRATVPEFGAARNPCDITAQVMNLPGAFEACMDAMLGDPAYAAVVMPVVYSHPMTTAGRIAAVQPLAARHGKPVVIAWLPERLEGPGAEAADQSADVALFRSMRRAMQALRLWLDGAACVDGAPPALPEVALPPGPALLGEHAAKRLLAEAGLPVIEERRARTAEAAAEAAAALGFPVALKLDSPDVAHKTEVGGVRLGLADAEAVRAGVVAILESAARLAPAARVEGVLVQRMAPRGVELILGARWDPQFGATVLLGLGGVEAEVWRDVTLELAPVSEAGALAMLRRLRGLPLLEGHRGRPACDLAAIARAVARFSAFAAAAGARAPEIEVNPLVCGPEGAVAVDGLIRLA